MPDSEPVWEPGWVSHAWKLHLREPSIGRSRVFDGKLLADGKLWMCGIYCYSALSLQMLWVWHWWSQPTWLSVVHTITITITIQQYHHHNHHHHYHQPPTKLVCLIPKSTGYWLLLPLRKLSQRSTLPKIQLATFPAESEAAIVNTMILRQHEILSWWPLERWGVGYHTDRHHDIGQYTPPATSHLPHTTCHMPPAAYCRPNYARHKPAAPHLPVPANCNSASFWIEHAGAYSE